MEMAKPRDVNIMLHSQLGSHSPPPSPPKGDNDRSRYSVLSASVWVCVLRYVPIWHDWRNILFICGRSKHQPHVKCTSRTSPHCHTHTYTWARCAVFPCMHGNAFHTHTHTKSLNGANSPFSIFWVLYLWIINEELRRRVAVFIC